MPMPANDGTLLTSIYDELDRLARKGYQPTGVRCTLAGGLLMRELYGSELFTEDARGNWVKYEEPKDDEYLGTT